jgi:hypothetical protein
VLVRVVPRGGGGGQGKNIGTLIAGILLIVVGFAISGTWAGFASPYLISFGVSLVLSSVINMLIPPAKTPTMKALAGAVNQNAPESPALSISGQTNTARPYNVVPRIFGRHKVFPPYAAMPFTEMVGADQYLRLLFCVGLGPTEIEELKIGDTAIENFQGVETEIRVGYPSDPPLTLYTTDVNEAPLAVVLLAGAPVIRTSSTNAVELSIDLAFPEGLVQFDNSGAKLVTSVSVTVEYRLVGATTWLPAPGSPIVTTDARQSLARNGLRWTVTNGQYDVRLTRTTADSTDPLLKNSSVWSSLRTFGAGAPVNLPGLSLVAMRIKATDQLNGVVDSFNCIAHGLHLDFTSYPSVVLADTPIGYWRLGEVAGAPTAFDSSGNDHPGTYRGSPQLGTPGLISGDRDTAMLADGIDDGVDTFTGMSIYDMGSSDFTIECLIQPATLSGTRGILRKSNGAEFANGAVGWALEQSGSVLQFCRGNGVGTPVPLAVTIVTGQPYHVVVTYAIASGLAQLWINGTPVATANVGSGTYPDTFNLEFAADRTGLPRQAPPPPPSPPTPHTPTPRTVTLFTYFAPRYFHAQYFAPGYFSSLTASTGAASGTATVAGLIGPVFTTGAASGRATGAGITSGATANYFAPGYFHARYFAPGYFTFRISTGSPGPGPGTTNNYFHPRYFAPGYFANGYFTFGLVTGVGGWIAPYIFAPPLPTIPPTGGAGGSVPPFWFAVSAPPVTGGRFAGTLDDVALYGSVLSGTRIALHYDSVLGSGGWALRRTSNPASHYREVLQGPGNARPVPDSRLDLPEFESWHSECAAGGRSHNRVVDFTTTIYQLLREIAACGRATPTMNDLKFAVVRDLAQTVPRQIFTPRNSRNFRGTRVMPDELHALKVSFIDPASNWQQVERIAYKDGYGPVDAPGIIGASRFEALDLPGCTDPDLAWRFGRYHLAAAQLRPESYSIETDIENLACRRGDLVQVAHDVTEWGVAWGRVKFVTRNSSGLGISVTLDEAVPMAIAATPYAMRFRFADLTSAVVLVTTPPGPGLTNTLTFPTPMVPPLPQPGDLALLGVVGKESVPAIVSMIRPGADLSAVLTLVDAAPAVLVADQLPIPPWDPQMTLPIPTEQQPPTPIIEAVISDESVLIRALDGSLRSAIVVTLHYLATSNVQADYLEARIKRSGSTSPFDILPQLPAGTTRVTFGDVEDGLTYDIRLRTVNRRGPASPSAEVLNYRVIGKTSPPPAPINVRVTGVELNRLEWDYPYPPPDLDGFLVRGLPGSSVSWEAGVELHVGVVSASPFILPPLFGTWTVMVAAVDTSGNESDAASTTVQFADVRIHNLVESYDYKAAGFPGTIHNGSVVGGNLEADGVPTVFWGPDTARFWLTNPLALFWQGSYLQMEYDFSFTPASGSAGARLLFEVTMVAESWTMEYEPSVGVWLPFPGSLENITASAYNFRIITAASATQAVLSTLKAVVDADDVTEDQSNIAIAATTGTRLTLQQTYRAITSVTATVRASGSETAISVVVVDHQNTAGAGNGPLLRCYDAAGAVVAGHVNVTVKGY